ncbi:MAG TPA: ABC transporter permease [Thermoanaerobaculia bacterium]
MIRHLLKLVWKRKMANALLILEIFLSFLVLFVVTTLAVSMVTRYRKPLGFDYHDVWVGEISIPSAASITPEQRARLFPVVNQLMREVRSLPEVESVAASITPPYGQATWGATLSAKGRRVDVIRDTVSDDFRQVLRMRLHAGRWFSTEDDAASMRPLVIDSDAAEALFGTENPIGADVNSGSDGHYRVIGVVDRFRKDGEFSTEHVNMVFGRLNFQAVKEEVPSNLLIRLRPGTPADFEEKLNKRLHAVAPDFAVRVRHMDQMRTFVNNLMMAPAIAGSVIAAFLIIMVALGLSGVLWQSVTRRTRELGLRRALGATSGAVHRQVLIEVALLSSLAVAVGVCVIAQLPLLGAFHLVSPSACAIGLLAAAATIYAITLTCGLYPSWLAGKVQPAQALHYE